MLTKEQIEQAEKIGKKEESVRLLLDFYLEADGDGEKKLSNAFNTMLCDYADHISKNKLQDIEANELLKIKTATEIFKNLKSVTGGAKKEEVKEEGSFLDRKANDKRRD